MSTPWWGAFGPAETQTRASDINAMACGASGS